MNQKCLKLKKKKKTQSSQDLRNHSLYKRPGLSQVLESILRRAFTFVFPPIQGIHSFHCIL